MKAFPANGNFTEEHNGMDLRDYFAAKAMQAFLQDNVYNPSKSFFPKWSYEIADAMMKAREVK